MRAVGMIVEYNPFHRGHELHLRAAKAAAKTEFAVAVMSGHFLQRGEPALFDKWSRAQMAILAGVDLVLELPVAFAARSAAYFANGGIRLLNSLGVVSHVCFGSETADLETLKRTAAAINQPEVINRLRTGLRTGLTYAAALGQALADTGMPTVNLANSPNNILSLEYIRAMQEYAPHLVPVSIKREHSSHCDTTITGSIASSSAIRRALLKAGKLNAAIDRVLPATSVAVINKRLATGQGPVTLDALESIILANLRLTSVDEIANLPDVGEGLHHTIHKAALTATDIEDLLTKCKSKRYTRTRLQRILIHSLLGTTKEQLDRWHNSGPLYARILAFNQRGRLLLKEIKAKATIPVITKTALALNGRTKSYRTLDDFQQMLALDMLASDLYVLGYPNKTWRSGGWDYRQSPLYITNPQIC